MSLKVNRAVVYRGSNQVKVETISYPTFRFNAQNKDCQHGAIIKVIASNICGSDLHMVRGRTSAMPGLVLGHEITGEVVEIGRDVEFIKVGDLVSVPFNISCGKCNMCKQSKTELCLNVNPSKPGGIYGYTEYGGWIGGQAEYVMTPYADFNLLKLPPKEKCMHRIKDIAMLTDVFPTGYHGAVMGGVEVGSSVYIAGAGPVGLSCAASCFLMGASCVVIADNKSERLAQARSFGCKTIDISSTESIPEQLFNLIGEPFTDCVVDCVGFEARGCGHLQDKECPTNVLNTALKVCRAGGAIGVPGVYIDEDFGSFDPAARVGHLNLEFGAAWPKSITLSTGQTPVMRYHRKLLNCIMNDRIEIAKCLNATVIGLEDAPVAYAEFDKGCARKFIIDPHNSIPR
jgi:glutathione-independent formaldehyde dehydrogenase